MFDLVLFFMGTNEHVGIEPTRVVLKGFPVAKVVNARPRGPWPAVVELPKERSHVARHNSAADVLPLL